MLVGTTSFAGERKTAVEEQRGAIAGAVVGAGLAGPFGAAVGAIFGGGIVGKLVGVTRINRELESELNQQVVTNRQQLKTYSYEEKKNSSQVKALNDELGRLLKSQTASWNSRQLPIQFRTNSSKIEAHYESQLYEIALNLSQNQETSVILSGFADRRGDAEHNQKLSEQRVGAVKAFLLGRGVQENQIQEHAFGETKPLKEQETSENNFFDRRVVLEFSTDVDSQVATR